MYTVHPTVLAQLYSVNYDFYMEQSLEAGQLYKSPLHRLKLDKTGLNWPKLVKTGLFQKHHVLQTKSTYNV